jgi:ubiquitin-protein ligase
MSKASSQCIKRLQIELKTFQMNPIENLKIVCSDNTLEWYFVMTFVKGTMNEGAEILGKIWFPAEYPFKAPGIMTITPNGSCNSNESLCLSTTLYHQETWNPSLHASSIILGLMSEMENPERNGFGFTPKTPIEITKRLASESREFNSKNAIFQKYFA